MCVAMDKHVNLIFFFLVEILAHHIVGQAKKPQTASHLYTLEFIHLITL